MERKIAIIGGGPAGLMAAIAAKRQATGATVVVFEATDRVGKKILVTGNGRCNLTNAGVDASAYKNPDFVRGVLAQFGYAETIALFKEMGVLTVLDGENRCYPRTKQATTVLNCMRAEIERLGIKTELTAKVAEIKKQGNSFSVNGQKFDRVVLATGGGNADAAKAFGHTVVPCQPSLSAIVTDKKNLVGLNGKRVDAILTLQGKSVKVSERGEVLFRENGISGIAAFNHSARIARQPDEWKIILDVVPEISSADLVKEIAKRDVKVRGADSLEGIVDRFIAQNAIKAAGTSPAQIAAYLKGIEYKVLGIRAEGAQVASGGVAVGEIDGKMQSKLQKGLYFAGEVVDVDGLCGGYNLQWAWSSGVVAGKGCVND